MNDILFACYVTQMISNVVPIELSFVLTLLCLIKFTICIFLFKIMNINFFGFINSSNFDVGLYKYSLFGTLKLLKFV